MAKESAAPPSETKRIQPTHGVYANTHIDIPTADAEAAIADGWAIDPYAEVDPNPRAEPKEFSAEDHANATAAADRYTRKLRGEPEPDEAKPAKKAEAKSSDASGDAGYQTRQASAAPAAKPAAAAPVAAPASTAAKSTK